MLNKRIQELALQAGAKLGPYVHNVSLLQPDGTYKWDEDRHTDTTTMDLEKFAMLVIQDYENDVRESRREVKSQLGYSRIGRNNV